MRLVEFDPGTLTGSFGEDLIFNKAWLIRELAKLQDSFSTIYILGSWYGNLSLMLARSQIKYQHIINVDTNSERVSKGQAIAQHMGLDDRIESMIKDANQLDYRSLDQHGAVINCSIHDMPNLGWFDHIPDGVMVVLQSRQDVDHAIDSYQLSKVLYQGSLELTDPETDYVSLLRIGIK
jgi:SAM-dependent methyltransferase